MQRCLTIVLLLLVASATPISTDAAVVDWELIKARGYEQTENNLAPSTSSTNIFFGELIFDTSSGLAGVSLGGAPGSPLPYSDFGSSPGFAWELDLDFPNAAALDVAIPDGGVYSIDVPTSAGVVSESISFSGGYPSQVPFFSGTLYETLQGFDSSQDLTLAWDDASGTGMTTVEVFIADAAGDFDVIYEENPALPSKFVPGGTLEPGKEYIAVLVFVNETDDPRDSFSSGEGLSGYLTFTEINFTTALVPEPTTASLIALGLLTFRLSPRRKPRG